LIYVTLSLGLHSSIQWMKKKKIYLSLLIKISLDMNHLKHWFERKIKTHAKYELFVDVLHEKMFIVHIISHLRPISNVWYIIIVRIKNTLVSLNLL